MLLSEDSSSAETRISKFKLANFSSSFGAWRTIDAHPLQSLDTARRLTNASAVTCLARAATSSQPVEIGVRVVSRVYCLRQFNLTAEKATADG